jgi:hypothetical protein
VCNTCFNNISVISWQSVFLVEETGVPGENHQPVTSHWQTLWIKYTLLWAWFKLTTLLVIGTDCIGSFISNYHMITTKTAPKTTVCLFDGVYCLFQQYFSYIVAVSFIGGGNRRTRKKTPTCRKSLTNLIIICKYKGITCGEMGIILSRISLVEGA